MDTAMTFFEKATDRFLKNPSQETFNAYLNAFTKILVNKSEVYPLVIIEDNEAYGGPTMRLNRITVGDKFYHGFCTSKRRAASCSIDSASEGFIS